MILSFREREKVGCTAISDESAHYLSEGKRMPSYAAPTYLRIAFLLLCRFAFDLYPARDE